jgi:hypothetical protein
MNIRLGIYSKTNWGVNPYPLIQQAALPHGAVAYENKYQDVDAIYFDSVHEKDITFVCEQIETFLAHKDIEIFINLQTGTFDPDHFSHTNGTYRKYRTFEKYLNEVASGVFAPNEDAVGYMKAAGWTAPIYNISGSIFSKPSVLRAIGPDNIIPFEERPYTIAFSNSLTAVNQPHYFMDLVEEYMHAMQASPVFKFKFISKFALHSDVDGVVKRAESLKKKGLLEIHEALTTQEFLSHLNESRVLFNCSLSSSCDEGMNEADTLGCTLLFPAVRGFPELFAHDPNRLYIPWSEDDPFNKLSLLLDRPHHNTGLVSDWNNKTAERIIDVLIDAENSKWNRHSSKYRNNILPAKYQVVKIEE